MASISSRHARRVFQKADGSEFNSLNTGCIQLCLLPIEQVVILHGSGGYNGKIRQLYWNDQAVIMGISDGYNGKIRRLNEKIRRL